MSECDADVDVRDDPDDPDELTTLGVVVDDERGSLPYSLIHGEALVAAAAWALGEADVSVVDLSVPWMAVREAAVESSACYVMHDSLCPMTPPDFIAACVRAARAEDAVVVGVRPVTDTIKHLGRHGDETSLGVTLDRDQLVSVCSPIVLPASVVGGLRRLPSLDFAVLASVLADTHPVVRLTAPPAARRVDSSDDVAVLEALSSRA